MIRRTFWERLFLKYHVLFLMYCVIYSRHFAVFSISLTHSLFRLFNLIFKGFLSWVKVVQYDKKILKKYIFYMMYRFNVWRHITVILPLPWTWFSSDAYYGLSCSAWLEIHFVKNFFFIARLVCFWCITSYSRHFAVFQQSYSLIPF